MLIVFRFGVKFHGVPMITFSEDGLSVISTKLGTPLMFDSYTPDMCMQSWDMSSYARAMVEHRSDEECSSCKVFGHILDECHKNIVSDVGKNLKNPRQAAKGVQVGSKVAFKPIKQVYRHVSNRNNASTSGKKKQAVVSSREVSNSNSFDVNNSVENDDHLGTNRGHSKSAGKEPNSGVFPSDHIFFNVESSSTSTTPIVERINKIERQIIDEKLTLVNDNGKPLHKVVSMANVDSDSEVEDVVDKHAFFMASTGLKRGANSGYGTNNLLEQWKTTKQDDNYDPYDDDLYESHDMSENLQAICDDFDITVRDRKKK
ncbi:hypothetical protein Tco_0433075 [Tanacetum coccineum]